MPWYYEPTFIKVVVNLTSAITGLGGGVLWVAQGDFISACSCEENKGLFASIFWWFQTSQIIGYIIAAQVYASTINVSFLFIIFGLMSVTGSLLMYFLKKPQKNERADIIKQMLNQTEVSRET